METGDEAEHILDSNVDLFDDIEIDTGHPETNSIDLDNLPRAEKDEVIELNGSNNIGINSQQEEEAFRANAFSSSEHVNHLNDSFSGESQLFFTHSTYKTKDGRSDVEIPSQGLPLKRHKQHSSDGAWDKIVEDKFAAGNSVYGATGIPDEERILVSSHLKDQQNTLPPTQPLSGPRDDELENFSIRENGQNTLPHTQPLSDLRDDKLENFSSRENGLNVDELDNASLNIYERMETKLEAGEQKMFDVTCPFCNALEGNLRHLELHIEMEHPEFSNDIEADQCNTDDTAHRIAFSGESQPFQFVCPLCDLDLEDEVTLDLHVKELHDENESTERIPCPLCDVSCSSEQAMKQHIETHTSDLPVYGISISHDEGSLTVSPPDMVCPMCGLAMLDQDLLISHVESHFNPQHSIEPQSVKRNGNFKENIPVKSKSKDHSDTPQRFKVKSGSEENIPSTSRAELSSDSDSREDISYKQQYEANLQRAMIKGDLTVADYYEQRMQMRHMDLKGVDDGHTRTRGLVEKLDTLYCTQARPGQDVFLCSSTDHFSASYGDKGWGCGYRNCQMILSCLVNQPDYAKRLFPDGKVFIPSIPKIQELIELAWKKGFDPQGCQQLKGQLTDTRKWIGATEIVTVLSSLGVKCHLVDFHAPSASDGTHPQLLEWIKDYFFTRQLQFLPPLYLQHQGHSRIIVGVEIEKGATKILLFDPGTSSEQMMAIAKGQLSWKHMRIFRRTQAGFRAKQYQIVSVVGLLTDTEYQESKTLKSHRFS